MSKQDRQGVRTPADIERKYELGQIASQKDTSGKQSIQISQLSQTLAQFMARMTEEVEVLNQTIENLQGNFPVGSVYVSMDESEPSEKLGGVWELMAEGHLLLGVPQEEESQEILQLDDTCYLWKRIE